MSSSGASSSSPFGYEPSYALAIVGATCFCLLGVIHFCQFFWYRTWVFYPMLLALLMEITGFISRAYSIHHTTILAPFLISYITVILAPSFIAAACYMVFGRIIYLVTPPSWRGFRTLWVPARRITPIFVTLDLLSFLIQLSGLGGVASAHSPNLSPAESEKKMNSGISTLRTGLIVQLFGFAIFTAVGARFVLVSGRWKSEWPHDGGRWRRCAWAVNVCCALVMLRAVYRVVEFTGTQGQGSYFDRYEWPFWVFDALIVLSVFITLSVIHPGMDLPASFTGFRLSKKHVDSLPRELENPFTITAIIGHRRKNHSRVLTADSEAVELN